MISKKGVFSRWRNGRYTLVVNCHMKTHLFTIHWSLRSISTLGVF